MSAYNPNQLVRLSDTTEFILEPNLDVRGRKVKDVDGEDLGKVHDLLIDQVENKVRALIVNHGHLLEKTISAIPVDAISSITSEEIVISHDKKAIGDAPIYDPTLVYDEDYYAAVYDYYGYPAYWYAGYVYPAYPYYV